MVESMENGTNSPLDTNSHPSSNIPMLKLVIVLIYSFLSLAIFFNLRVVYMVSRILFCQPITSRPDGNRHAFVYILSLSIVDSFVLASLPVVTSDIILSRWIFGGAVCKLYWLIEQVNRILSTFILTALSADRYLAICAPVKFTHCRTTLAAIGVICVCILIATGLLAPTFVYSHVEEWYVNNQTIRKCTFSMDPTTLGKFLIYIFVCGYCIPFLCMLYFYINIIMTLWSKRMAYAFGSYPQDQTNGTIVGTSSVKRRRRTARHVTKKALGLVTFYFTCWTPYWIVQFYIHFAVTDDEMIAKDSLIIILYAVHVLAYVNSAVNPFLYALLNKELQRQHSMTQKSRGQKTTICSENQQRDLIVSTNNKRNITRTQEMPLLVQTQQKNGLEELSKLVSKLEGN